MLTVGLTEVVALLTSSSDAHSESLMTMGGLHQVGSLELDASDKATECLLLDTPTDAPWKRKIKTVIRSV